MTTKIRSDVMLRGTGPKGLRLVCPGPTVKFDGKLEQVIGVWVDASGDAVAVMLPVGAKEVPVGDLEEIVFPDGVAEIVQ